ncbi:MAG TPA: hypothetical protein VKJ07_08200, partial [Mycobacteriales bacterium]|nr:hypothetical protein [Mycobacteriales bacterium]
LAGLDGAEYVVLLPSPETCVERVATRRGHGFSDAAATRHMHGEFASAEVEPRHVFVTDGEPAATTVEAVLVRRDDGGLRLG